MSDPQDDFIMNYFLNQSLPPGSRTNPSNRSTDKFQKYNGESKFSDINQSLGRRAKRVLDKNIHNKNYPLVAAIHNPSLEFYENMEWWERDSTNDFLKQINRKK
jgi:hypothetical protein